MSIRVQVFKTNADSKLSEGWDISDIVHDLEYTTSIMGQAGKLSFVIERDTGTSGFHVGMGYCVMFWHNEHEVFKGYVFSAGTDRTEAYRVVAYDQMKYLQSHSNELIDDNMTIKDVFYKIVSEAGIDRANTRIIGEIDDSIKIKSKLFIDTSYYDILQYALNWANSFAVTAEIEGGNNGIANAYYYLRDNFGVLELRETKYCGTHDENGNALSDWLIIGDRSLLTDYQYESSIDKETYNEFLFMYNPKDKKSSDSKTNEQVQGSTLIGAIQAGTTILNTNTKLDGTIISENTIPKWGKLRKIVIVNDISDKDLLAEYMRMNIEHFNQPTRSLKLSALGYDGVYAGDTFHLLLGKLQMNTAVYVLNATHRYNGDMHTMDLEVNTSPDIKVFS